jgi:integral membrane protein
MCDHLAVAGSRSTPTSRRPHHQCRQLQNDRHRDGHQSTAVNERDLFTALARSAGVDGDEAMVNDTVSTPATDPMRELRIAAVIEASTFLVLVGGAIAFRALHGPRLGPTLGPIHGAAFVAYTVTVLRAKTKQKWSLPRTLIIIGAAVVPIGGYIVAHRLGSNPSFGDTMTLTDQSVGQPFTQPKAEEAT